MTSSPTYEIFNYLLGDPQGHIPTIPGSFVRQAYKDGLAMQEARGYNPYKMGFVGGSDSHNTGVPYRQDNFFGGHGAERWRHQGSAWPDTSSRASTCASRTRPA